MLALKRGEPSLRGTLGSDPLGRLLGGLVCQGATGTLELSMPGGGVAQVLLVQGALAKIKTPTPLYLGAIVYELGFVSAEDLNASLLEVARAKRLHGAVMLERKLLSDKQLRQCLAVQAGRKAHELFACPPDTAFEFLPYYDALGAFGGSDGPSCDLRPLIWYGIRAFPPTWHMRAVLDAADRTRFRLVMSDGDAKALGFDDDEVTLLAGFRGRPRSIAELTGGDGRDQRRKETMVYFLLLMGALARESSPPKQVESGVREKVPTILPPIDPAVAAKLFDRAYLASQGGKLDLAESLCRQGLEGEPQQVNLRALRIWLAALRTAGQTELATQRAVAELSTIIAAHDECAHAHFFRGQLYKRLGRHERAACDFRETLQHDPRRADAQAELRLCVTRLRK